MPTDKYSPVWLEIPTLTATDSITWNDDLHYWKGDEATLCVSGKIEVDPDAWASILDVRPKIERVIFNEPATIVFWGDGTKTVVKAQNEPYDKEKGLAMAIAKKWFFNKGRYNNEIKRWVKE